MIGWETAGLGVWVGVAENLSLYRRAVQHPQAEVGFLLRAHAWANAGNERATLLKEDFAGTAAVAAAWVALDEDHQAMAVEAHGPTARWAERAAKRELGYRAQDLHVVQADVLEVNRPQVDVVAALNFSTFIYHDRDSLRNYFRGARRSLRPGGVAVIDTYGGPGAERTMEQRRDVPADPERDAEAFEYVWEQRAFDPVTRRTDCRIHFEFGDSRRINSAFRYDWRLWTLPELVELMAEAGLHEPTVWCDRYDAKAGMSDGVYRPVNKMEAREDWVAYVVGHK